MFAITFACSWWPPVDIQVLLLKFCTMARVSRLSSISYDYDVTEKLEIRYLMSSTGLRMETQKSANSSVKIYFLKNSKSLKNMILAGDFNVNILDYEQNKKVQTFFNMMYRYNMVPTINKPTMIGKNLATAIDHIIANCIVDCQFKTAILKSELVHQSQKVHNVHKIAQQWSKPPRWRCAGYLYDYLA